MLYRLGYFTRLGVLKSRILLDLFHDVDELFFGIGPSLIRFFIQLPELLDYFVKPRKCQIFLY